MVNLIYYSFSFVKKREVSMKFAIIGSNSPSGANLIDLLLEDPINEVIGISRSKEYDDIFLPYKRHKNGNFRFYQLNINKELPQILDLLDDFQPSYIINFAAQGEVGSSWKYPDHWFQTNAVGIVSFTNALKDKKYLIRYIHISTPEVYGTCNGQNEKESTYNPSSPYAASKAAADLFLQTLFKQYNFPLIIIRSTNIYGIGQQLYRIIPRGIILLKKGKKIPLHGGGKAIKSYIHIKDVCEGILKAAFCGKIGEVYHLSPTDDISVKELVKKICNYLNKPFEESVEITAERMGQDSRYFLNSEKARNELKWAPSISFDEGLKEMVQWIEDNWKKIDQMPIEYIHKL